MKILVADDDPISCRLMQRMLERHGYEVVVAADGHAAARELLREDGPRLALLDWMMPGLDGAAVCRQVRSRTELSYTYIVLLTSKQANSDIVAGLEAGADDYLTKPCNQSELKARLLTGQRILGLEEKLVEAREGMRYKATHDSLTQLLNRSAILSHLRESMERSVRDKSPVSLLLCDIDHFKKINDTHGHLAGDSVLKHFSARLKNAVRSRDAIGRYGGEEFLIVLDGCKSEDLAVRAEQVRKAVCSSPISVDSGVLEITASLGGTTANVHNRPVSAEYMIDQADVALYQAKAQGRNCVRIAERHPSLTAAGGVDAVEPVATKTDGALGFLSAVPLPQN